MCNRAGALSVGVATQEEAQIVCDVSAHPRDKLTFHWRFNTSDEDDVFDPSSHMEEEYDLVSEIPWQTGLCDRERMSSESCWPRKEEKVLGFQRNP